MTARVTGAPPVGHHPGEDFFAGIARPDRRRLVTLDLYRSPGTTGRRPAVVFVHGGPIPHGHVPRDSAVFTGYGALAASAGLVGIMFDHRLHATTDYPLAAQDLAAVVERARECEEVDRDRIALWCFSGGGALAADWLRAAPSWLRAIAWTYPVLAAPPDWPGDGPRFDCLGAAGTAPDLPKLLVRVGAEYPQLVADQEALVASARALDVIEIPGAVHGFEVQGYDDEARQAVERATAWVAGALGPDAGPRGTARREPRR